MKEILLQFGLSPDNFKVNPFGSGLINNTWLVEHIRTAEKFILQQVNTRVFKNPQDIDFNIRLMDNYLKQFAPAYLFVAALPTISGSGLFKTGDAFYRMFRFVNESHTVDVVENPKQAFEAAKQFGRFTRLLSGLDASRLKITLPGFHDLVSRYQHFELALQTGDQQRVQQSSDLITYIQQHKGIVDEFENCKTLFKTRCTHHDTKISNVLFNAADEGLCVIDLDTVMPGYFISDVGDMMRTYLCPVSEEEKDLSKICIRPEFYKAIVAGYLSEMEGELSGEEKKYFHFAGQFMIYMQALRFLTDHLNNDLYYGARYEGHNFVRAANQARLLQCLQQFNPG